MEESQRVVPRGSYCNWASAAFPLGTTLHSLLSLERTECRASPGCRRALLQCWLARLRCAMLCQPGVRKALRSLALETSQQILKYHYNSAWLSTYRIPVRTAVGKIYRLPNELAAAVPLRPGSSGGDGVDTTTATATLVIATADATDATDAKRQKSVTVCEDLATVGGVWKFWPAACGESGKAQPTFSNNAAPARPGSAKGLTADQSTRASHQNSRKGQEPAELVKDAPNERKHFKEGDTVLGNFKGLGDWDEAVVVGVNTDGTYVLDYVDEGLMEEN
eukprot:6193884-Pleurochrysis_carterae.AAC.1